MNQIQHLFSSLWWYISVIWLSYCKQHYVAYKCFVDGLDKTNKQLQGKDVIPTNRLMKVLCKLQYCIKESIWHCLPENIRRSPVKDFFLVESAGLVENDIFDRINIGSHFGEKTCYNYFPNILWSHYQVVSNWPSRAEETPDLP